jgi:AcrR family transcriptional regulator
MYLVHKWVQPQYVKEKYTEYINCATGGAMPVPPDRRSRKRLATRQAISNAATCLFIERGFDHVTVDEIAAAADVGRMTVFNHFPRKEDMFFDRDEEGRELLRETLRQRDPRVAPIEAYRLLAHRLVAEASPYLSFSAAGQAYIETIEGSETLKARARAIRDELAHAVTVALAECVGREPTDPDAHLAAGLLLSTWTVALIQAHRTFRQSRDTEKANAAFLAIVDKGSIGAKAAMAGTPYA